MKRFNYTYLIYCNDLTSSLYGCIYYGKHSTDNLNDGYIASGIKIRNYIKKYPNSYYRKILNFYNTPEELKQAEYELIHPHLGKPYCLNLREGGDGGYTTACYDDIKKQQHSLKISNSMKGHNIALATKQKISETRKQKFVTGEITSWNKGKTKENDIRVKQLCKKTSETRKRKCATGEITTWNKGKKGLQTAWNKGIPRSEELKMKQSERMKLYHKTHKKRLCEDGKYHFIKIN